MLRYSWKSSPSTLSRKALRCGPRQIPTHHSAVTSASHHTTQLCLWGRQAPQLLSEPPGTQSPPCPDLFLLVKQLTQRAGHIRRSEVQVGAFRSGEGSGKVVARSGHGTDSWSAGQVARETAGLNGQSSGRHPQTAGIRSLL